MAEEHDKTHRLLFNFASMVEDLIRICLPGPWIERLDFSSLEQVSERFLDEDGDMKRREADLIWRVRYGLGDGDSPGGEQDWFYIYLNLEHMSQIRRLMVLDTENYRLGAWKQIARNAPDQLPDGLLPPILSVVFYNGDQEWRPRMLPELVRTIPDAPPGFELGTFVLVDAQRWQVTRVESPLEALFKLEQVESIDDVKTATRQTRDAVGTDAELARAFVALLNNVVFRKLAPDDEKPLRIESLEETTMLEQRIERIAQGLILQGKAEGILQGEAAGIRKGEAAGIRKGEAAGIRKGERQARESLFLKLYAAKFGQAPSEISERAARATARQLETWSERLLTVDRPDHLFLD